MVAKPIYTCYNSDSKFLKKGVASMSILYLNKVSYNLINRRLPV